MNRYRLSIALLPIALLLSFAMAQTKPLESNQALPINQLPKRIDMTFSGPFGVPARMLFTHTDDTYQISTRVAIPFKPINFEAHGFVAEKGLNPTSYQDIRSNKLYAYANFDYQNNMVTYGKADEKKEATIDRPTKDFFTLAWEMALNDGKLLNSVVATNGKKLYTRDQFNPIEVKNQSINGRRTPVEIYSNGSGDDRIDLGFAKDHFNIPAVIAFYDKGRRYELRLTKVSY